MDYSPVNHFLVAKLRARAASFHLFSQKRQVYEDVAASIERDPRNADAYMACLTELLAVA